MNNRYGFKGKENRPLVIVIAIVYWAVTILLARMNMSAKSPVIHGVAVSGVLTAVLFLLAIGMTLISHAFGGIIATVLLSLSVITTILGMARSGSLGSLPGVCYYLVAIIAIIHIRRGFEKEWKISHTDFLTGISNRRNTLEYIDYLISKNRKFYLAYLNLDHFKYINDTLGHNVGDEILKSVVKVWSEIPFEESLLGRMGGDEFMCVIPKDENPPAGECAGKLVNALRNYKEKNGDLHLITTSVGVVAFPEDADTANEILRKADIALSHAKRDGRNKVCLYNAAFDKAFLREQTIERIIRDALDKQRFYMVYQPQFRTTSKKLRGFESLIRLDNGEGDHIGPGEFIPVAEKSDLIVEIGEYVLRRSLADFAKVMREEPDLTLSINISAKQILTPNFVELVDSCLKEYNFPPSALEIEITEYCFMDASEEAISVINRLKNLGVELALDDFGTGYSSLSYLSRLPFNILKIDKSLIDTISEGDVVRAIVTVGHTLGCEIISEGVEEEPQVDILRSIDCDYIQGFVWGRPMELRKAMELITDEQEDTLI